MMKWLVQNDAVYEKKGSNSDDEGHFTRQPSRTVIVATAFEETAAEALFNLLLFPLFLLKKIAISAITVEPIGRLTAGKAAFFSSRKGKLASDPNGPMRIPGQWNQEQIIQKSK